REAGAGDVDAVLERLPEAVRAVVLEDVLPQRGRAGDAGAQAAVAVDRELRVRRRLAVDEERVRLHLRGRGLAAVERRDPAGAAAAARYEPPPAGPPVVRLDAAEPPRARDRGVEGFPAAS